MSDGISSGDISLESNSVGGSVTMTLRLNLAHNRGGIKCLRQKGAGAAMTSGGQGATKGRSRLGVVGCARILPAHLRGIARHEGGGV